MTIDKADWIKAGNDRGVHIFPKRYWRRGGIVKADAELLGYCQIVAAKIARQRGIESGYRTVYNVGPGAGQSVFHLHLHLLGASVGRMLNVRVTSVAGKELVDLQVFPGFVFFV